MDIITLIKALVSGLVDAEEDFLKHLDTFSMFEESVRILTNQMAADFIGMTLSNADSLIRESGIRKRNYTVQRSRQRTLISSVGDVTFTHTLYKDQEGKTRCLLDELIRLPDRERFTPVAEAKVLNEAEVHSYRHAAESIQTKGQTITKTTVMNKVHSIEKEIPEMEEPAMEKNSVNTFILKQMRITSTDRRMERGRDVLSASWSISLKEKKKSVMAGESWCRLFTLEGFMQVPLRMQSCGNL